MIRVHVVTSCTDRKKTQIGEEFRLGAIPDFDLQTRIAHWTRRLEGARRTVAARDLYGGEHWFEFLKILARGCRPGVEVKGWVVSAGYGLIPTSAQVTAYSASFNRASGDRARPGEAAWDEADWWEALAAWRGPSPGTPRTFSALARDLAGDLVLVAMSPVYLRAVKRDLMALITEKPEVLLFSSSAHRWRNELGDRIVSFDSRLRPVVGGSQVGLNIRTLAYALREATGATVPELQAVVKKLMAELPEPELTTRSIATDGEVRDFIRSELRANPAARPTPLLRRWRSLNRACEQGRFRALFLDVQDESNHEAQMELGS